MGWTQPLCERWTMRWLRKLFGLEEIPVVVKVKEVQVDPDPDMEPGQWEWSCLDCPEGNTGEAQAMRAEAFQHCLATAHAVSGNHHGEEY